MVIFIPSGKIQLTNVSIVRLKKGGKRFEIACYKNKVAEWRNGNEKDIDEVLQIHQIFTNVSKGQVAKSTELTQAFKTTEQKEIIQEILKKGEIQITEKERSILLESMLRDICVIIATKCVNPATNKPYTIKMIEKAIVDELHYSVKINQSAKKQALDVIKLLQSKKSKEFPIRRVQMRCKVVFPALHRKMREKVVGLAVTIEEERRNDEKYEMVCLIDPGQFRPITELISTECKDEGECSIMSMFDSREEDSAFL